MRRQVRRNVFETNSSSMHSLSIAKKGVTEYLHVDEYTNKVITEFGEFGWGYEEYNDPETKLSYLVTMLVETHSDCYSLEELYNTEDFKKINDIVAARCECDGVEINEKITQMVSFDGKKYDWNSHEGYIDHQSVEAIDTLLERYNCTIEEFIFDKGITLVIDNDNY